MTAEASPSGRGGTPVVLYPLIGLLAVSTGVFALLWLSGPLAEGPADGEGGGRVIDARSGSRGLRVAEGGAADRPALAVEARLPSRDFEELAEQLGKLASSQAAADQAKAFFASPYGRAATPPVSFTFPGRGGRQTLEVYALDARRQLCYCRLAGTKAPVAVRAEAYRKLAARLTLMGGGTVGRFAVPYYVTLGGALRERLAELAGPLAVTAVAGDGLRQLTPGGGGARPGKLLVERPDPLTLSVTVRLSPASAMARGLAEALARASAKVTARHLDSAARRDAVRDLATLAGRKPRDLDDTLVFQYGDRLRVVAASELVQRGGAAGADPGERFAGDEVVLRTIDDLIAGRGLVYFTEGHGERRTGDTSPSGLSAVAAVLRQTRTLRAATLDLAERPRIPGDCAALVMAGPRKALSPDAEKAVLAYLKQGGRLALMLDPPSTPPLLADVLKSYGIAVLGPDEQPFPKRPGLGPGVVQAAIDRKVAFAREWTREGVYFLTPCALRVTAAAPDAPHETLAVVHAVDGANVEKPPCLVAAVRPRAGATGPRLLVFGNTNAFGNHILRDPEAKGNLAFLLDALTWLTE